MLASGAWALKILAEAFGHAALIAALVTPACSGSLGIDQPAPRERVAAHTWLRSAWASQAAGFAASATMLRVPLFPSASDAEREGFVRVINRSADPGEVHIHAFDNTGVDYDLVTLSLDGGETAHFHSDDLELGNPGKGLSGSTGTGGGGNWHLELSSDLDIEVLSYIRTADGFLTSMHDVVPSGEFGHRVVTFNPGSNANQVSQLRLNNPGTEHAQITIRGVDDAGKSPGVAVQTTIPAGTARSFTSLELESGGDGLHGALGDGTGKWRLTVESSRPVVVMSLLASPTGHLTNLSTAPSRSLFTEPLVRTVAENTGGDEAIGEPVTADFGMQAELTHALEGADGDSFEIDAWSGQLRTRTGATYDYETQENYGLVVRVMEALGGMARVPVTVEVNDVDEPPAKSDTPEVEGVSSRSVLVSWETPENTGPEILDYDVQYRREGAEEYTDANHEGVEREIEIEYLRQRADYEFRVRASNAEGTGEWSEPTRGRARGGGGGGGGTTPPPPPPPQNRSPAFDEGPTARREFAANTPAGQEIGAPIRATDSDRDTLVYSLGGTDAASFDIDINSGQLKTKAGIDYGSGMKPSYSVIVTAVDGRGGSATIEVTVAVTTATQLVLNFSTIAGDNRVNIAEKAAGFTIFGDTGSVGSVLVSVEVDSTTLMTTSSSADPANWSVSVPAYASYITESSVSVTVSASKTGYTAPSEVTRTLTVDLTAPSSPTYTVPASLKVGVPITAMNPSTTTDTDIALYRDAGLPSGLTLNAITGEITGTPDTANANPQDATVTITDTAGNPRTASITFPAVAKGYQSLTGFSYSADQITEGDAAPTVTVPSGAQTTLEYSAEPSSVCGVNSSTGALNIAGTGTCTITAEASSNANYNEATATFTLTINPVGTPVLNLAAIAGDNTVNVAEKAAGFAISGNTGSEGSVSVTVTVGSTDLTATSSSADPATWSVSVPPAASYITETSVNVTVSASKTEHTVPSNVTRTLTVDLTAPSARTYTAPSSLKVGVAITAMNPSSAMDTDIDNYSVTGLPSGLSINASTGVITGTPDTADANIQAATVTIEDNAGNTRMVSITFPAVAKGDQTLTGFAYSASQITEGDAAPTVTAPSGAQTTLEYSAEPTSVCTVDSGTGALTIVGTGACTISAKAPANVNYNETTDTFELTVNVVAPSSLVANGSFESGGTGWLVWGGASVVNSEASDGTSALLVGEFNGAEQTVTGLQPNTRYTLTGSAKVAGSNALAIGVKQHGGNEEDMQFTSSSYTTKSLTFTTGFASTSAKIYVFKAVGTEAGYGDNIVLTQGSGSDYSLTWSDEFGSSGNVDSSKWSFETGFVRNEELQWYQSGNASLSDGNLVIEGREQTFANPDYVEASTDWRTNREFVNYTSSSIKTENLAQWRYSKIVVRAKVTNHVGTWPAIWTLGIACEWPSNGEVDIMENYGGNILANFAWGTDTRWSAMWDAASWSVESLGTDWADQFHVWELDWDEHRMSIYVDGVLLNDRPLDASLLGDQSSDIPTNGTAACQDQNPFKQSHYLLLNLALGGTQGGSVEEFDLPYTISRRLCSGVFEKLIRIIRVASHLQGNRFQRFARV